MCGICAYIGPLAGNSQPQMELALDKLRHRGPDDHGQISGNGFMLGQTRLHIVGKDGAGRQPRSEHSTHLIFNGEVHNYLELGAALLATGKPVDIRSDTSVVHAALQHWGVDAFQRFRGFWALVFVDESKQQVICARDRFGQKPLLYTTFNQTLRFASEAAALGVALRPSESAIHHFIHAAQYPPSPSTFYDGVSQVEPGSYLSVNLETLNFQSHAYYQPPTSIREPVPVLAKAAESFAERLRQSVALRLRADVPVGLLLSAGKDSGTLHHLLPKTSAHPAFTFANGDIDDESSQAMAWYSQDRPIEIAHLPHDLPRQVVDIHSSLDAPALSASLLALDALYEKARQANVPVLLSGQGADEVLGGYQYYSGLQGKTWQKLGARLESLGGIGRLPTVVRDYREAQTLLRPFAKTNFLSVPDTVSEGGDPVTQRRLIDLRGSQLQTMLWYEDRLSMRHSVETRCPFLDVDLVNFCLSLPGDYFVSGKARKRLLTEAFGHLWPLALQQERVKRGLPAAEGKLLRKNAAFAELGLTAAFGYFGVQLSPKPYLAAISRGPRTAKATWRLVMLGHWLASVSVPTKA